MARSKRIRLKEYIQANNTIESYSSGDLVVTTGPSIFFWGNIKDMRSPTAVVLGNRDDNRKIEILCRTRDVVSISNGTELTLDSRAGTYQVDDIFDSDYKFHSIITAYQITN